MCADPQAIGRPNKAIDETAVASKAVGNTATSEPLEGAKQRRRHGGSALPGMPNRPKPTGPAWLKHIEGLKVRKYPFSVGCKWRYPVIGTVIHATKGGRADKIKFTKKSSWHFTVARDGTIYQHRSIHRSAGHAGRSKVKFKDHGKVRKGTWVNNRTFGIELANYMNVVKVRDGKKRRLRRYNHKQGFVTNRGTPGIGRILPGDMVVTASDGPADNPSPIGKGEKVQIFWEEYPPQQVAALERLLGEIARAGYIDALNLIRHEKIHPGKRDPGPQFPMKKVESEVKRMRTNLLLQKEAQPRATRESVL